MQVNVSSRHGNISPDVMDYTISRVEGLGKYNNRITNIDVVFDQVKESHKDSHSVELVAHVGHSSTLVAKHTGEELMPAFDATYDKLERQLRRLKERMKDHRPHHGQIPQPPEENEDEEELFEGEEDFEKEL